MPPIPILAALAAALAAPAAASPFTLIIHEDDAALAARTDPERAPAYWAAFAEYGKALTAAGVLRGGAALTPAAPTDLVRTGGAGAALAAPRVSGYFIIDVAGHADAVAWAQKLPGAALVEVRAAIPSPAMAR